MGNKRGVTCYYTQVISMMEVRSRFGKWRISTCDFGLESIDSEETQSSLMGINLLHLSPSQYLFVGSSRYVVILRCFLAQQNPQGCRNWALNLFDVLAEFEETAMGVSNPEVLDMNNRRHTKFEISKFITYTPHLNTEIYISSEAPILALTFIDMEKVLFLYRTT
ncbi:hypothetical protein EYC80_007146 [Monilinia laxa]|uniref:Uncharacterized protein n=1 Tax=Monilinia laxa TaxID=61186 RepID=A0A5N6K0D9_MONLA|nr:hypothetical protein EYC80_007146 [Monilinia laxa]